MLNKGSNVTITSSKMITEKDHWRVHAIVPAIPFEVPEQKKVPKGGTIKIDVKVDPERADSETFEVEIKLFGSGTPEEWLEFFIFGIR